MVFSMHLGPHTWHAFMRQVVTCALQGLPPVIVLLSSVNPAILSAYQPPTPLVGPLLLTGFMSDRQDLYGQPATIDFTYQSTPMLPIDTTGSLMIQMMVRCKAARAGGLHMRL